MGSRALVAYEQAPDEYELHYSHNGAIEGRLLRLIGPDTPYADGQVDAEVWSEEYHASLRHILDDVMQYCTWEALYIVHDDWSVDMWVPVEYGEPGRGVLVPVSTYTDRDGQVQARGPSVEQTHAKAVWETADDLHEERAEAINYVEDRLASRYNGTQGRAASYDQPILSTERSIPAGLRAGTMSLSSMMGAKQ